MFVDIIMSNFNLDSKKKIVLAISIVQAIYVVYMFQYFKTTYSFETSRKLVLSGIFFHPVEDSHTPISHICPFGHTMAYPIAIYLIGRNFVLQDNQKLKNKINLFINSLILLGSLMNINAVVYLLPFFIAEMLLYYYT
jgi:hypothetical protein